MNRFCFAIYMGMVFLATQVVASAVQLPAVYSSFVTQRAKPKYLSFSFSSKAPYTFPVAINDNGLVAGTYTEANTSELKSFVRYHGGKIIKISSKSAIVTGMNNTGVIVGYYVDSRQIFVRSADGTTTTLDFLGESDEPVFKINDDGVIAGVCCEADAQHSKGFVRTADGKITKFHVGSVNTFVDGINASGVIVGHYYPEFTGSGSGGPKPYIRAVDGTITKFRIPNATSVSPTSINSSGAVVGFLSYPNNTGAAFERAADGTIITWTIPGSAGNTPASISDDGTVAGTYYDTNSVAHGYLRSPDGTITTFDPPGSLGTVVSGRNSKGKVIGYFQHSGGGYLGFIRSQ